MAGRDNFSRLFSGNSSASSLSNDAQNDINTLIANLDASSDDDNVEDDRKETNLDPVPPSSLMFSSTPPSSAVLPANNSSNASNTSTTNNEDNTTDTKPGTESIQYLKKFGTNILGTTTSRLRELHILEKLSSVTESIDNLENKIENRYLEKRQEAQKKREEIMLARQLDAMNSQIEEEKSESEARRIHQQLEEEFKKEQSDKQLHEEDMLADAQLALDLQDQDEKKECELLKHEADEACKRIGWGYDALVKFTICAPTGTYEEFIEFLLMGGGRSEDHGEQFEEELNNLMFENFYAENSEYRMLWNDNLMLGLPEGASTIEGRVFAPAVVADDSNGDTFQSISTEGSSSNKQRDKTLSDDAYTFGQSLRNRTLSEGERIKSQIAHVDKQKIKRGLGSAVRSISNVSSYALKPLRDLQLAEKLNAMNIDVEEEEAQKEIEQFNRTQQDKKDLEEMMAIKKEAEEKCLSATKDHLISFINDNPTARYNEWIAEFHPENAHDGALLEGMGKTIDHRFYVEESDHRRMWNENLHTFNDPNDNEGRDYVPARAKQMDERTGTMVVADDILSGSVGRDHVSAPQQFDDNGGKSEDTDADLIAFD